MPNIQIARNIWIVDADPSSLPTGVFNPEVGSLIIDTVNLQIYQKTSAKGNNTGFRRAGSRDQSYNVSGLPENAALGDRAVVTDATAPTYLGELTGGGEVACPVFFNGTDWVSC
jgi:hypothetical protein